MNIAKATSTENKDLLLKSYIKVDNIPKEITDINDFITKNRINFLTKQIELRIHSHFDRLLIPSDKYNNKSFSYSLGEPASVKNGSYYILLSIFLNL